jgi:hypothetical protein
MNAEDETNVTDIELLPDGRICVFGASAEVLTVLDQLQCGTDPSVSDRLRRRSGIVDLSTISHVNGTAEPDDRSTE